MSDEQLLPASREELADAIDYALRFKVRLPMVGPRKARWQTDVDSQIAAKAIAEYLELCGFRSRKTPPPTGHGQAYPGPRKPE